MCGRGDVDSLSLVLEQDALGDEYFEEMVGSREAYGPVVEVHELAFGLHDLGIRGALVLVFAG